MKKTLANSPDLGGEDPLDQDLSDVLATAKFMPARFHFIAKDRTMTMRLPSSMVEALKAMAAREKMPYQALIRQYLADRLILEASNIQQAARRS
jgi:predicted DNA binding CopG/RHH family protein